MVTTGVLCTDANVKTKAGPYISSDIDSGDTAETDFWIDCAEGQLCAAAKYDWVTNYASVSAIGKDILRDAASSYAAVMAINYDTTGITTRASMATKINILWASFQKVIDLLEGESDFKQFILDGESSIS